MDARAWFVRAGERPTAINDFRTNNLVAIGWAAVEPLSAPIDDTALSSLFERSYPSARAGSRRVWLAQVRRFILEPAIGDRVATYDPDQRLYLLGTIETDVAWRESPLPRFRRVKSTHQVPRDVLTVKTRNALGSIATLFRAS